MNTGKTKLMKVGTFEETGTIQVGGGSKEEVEEFCYLGSVISRDGSCDKDIRTRLGKANTTFGRLSNLWKNKKLNLQVKVRLYESLVLSTLQYGSETWSMTVANGKKLEAAHHKWMRRILGITWKQMVTNEEVRKTTGKSTLEEILRRNRLRCSVVSVIRYISVSISILLLVMYFNSVSIIVLQCISVSISISIRQVFQFQFRFTSISVFISVINFFCIHSKWKFRTGSIIDHVS